MNLAKLIKKKKRLHGDFWVAQKCNATLKGHLGRAGKFIAPSNFGSYGIEEIDSFIIYGNGSVRIYGNWNPQRVLYLESFLKCGKNQQSLNPFSIKLLLKFLYAIMYCRF